MNVATFDYKMIIAIRKDLGLSKGRYAAYSARVAYEAFLHTKRYQINWVNNWLGEGQKKVVVKLNNDNHLKELAQKTRQNNIPSFVLKSGLENKNQEKSIAIGIGPGPSKKISQFTADLKLL
jgi:PTH2 family peptidyl-tRNA hydrolase